MEIVGHSKCFHRFTIAYLLEHVCSMVAPFVVVVTAAVEICTSNVNISIA